MKLLYTKRSPYARKVRVVAIEKNIHLELIDEDLAKKSKLLMHHNPLGKVPTLILDNGEVFYDSGVICQFLDNLNNTPLLIPKHDKERFDVLKWESLADDLVTTAINTYMEKIRHPNDFHAQCIINGEQSILKAFQHIESRLDDFEALSLAPIAIASALGYITFRLPHIKINSSLAQWFEQFSTRISMIQTIPTL